MVYKYPLNEYITVGKKKLLILTGFKAEDFFPPFSQQLMECCFLKTALLLLLHIFCNAIEAREGCMAWTNILLLTFHQYFQALSFILILNCAENKVNCKKCNLIYGCNHRCLGPKEEKSIRGVIPHPPLHCPPPQPSRKS